MCVAYFKIRMYLSSRRYFNKEDIMINKIKGAFLLLSALPCMASAENSPVVHQASVSGHSRCYIGFDIGSSLRMPSSSVEDMSEGDSVIDLISSHSEKELSLSLSGSLGYDFIYKSGLLIGGFARIGLDGSSCNGEVTASQKIAQEGDAAANAENNAAQDLQDTVTAEIDFSDRSRMFTQLGIRFGAQMKEVLLFASVAYYGAFVKSVMWDGTIDDDQDALIDYDIAWRNGISVGIGMDYTVSPDWLFGVSFTTNFVPSVHTLSTESYEFNSGFSADLALNSRPTDMSVMFGVKHIFGKNR